MSAGTIRYSPDIQHGITRLFHWATNPFDFIVVIQAILWVGKQLQDIQLEEEIKVKNIRAKTMDSQLLEKLILIASAFIVIDRNVKLLSTRVDITAGGWHCTTLTDEGQVYGWGRGDSWKDSMGYPTLIIIFAIIPIFAIAVCILDHFSLIPMYGITIATLGMLNTLASGCGLSNLMLVNAVLHNAFSLVC